MKKIITIVCLLAVIGLSKGFSLTITTGAISTPICAGSTISVPYTVSAQFNGANTFKAELSDSSGSFTTFTIIGTRADSVSGIITATVGANALGSSHYRIRVIGSSPFVNGADNGANITIVALPHPTITWATSVNLCTGDSVTLNAGAFTSYLWNTAATTSSITVYAAGTFTVTVTNATGCMGTDGQVVNLYTLPVVDFSGLPAAICSNAGSIALTGNPTGGHFSGIGVTNANFNPNNLSGNHTVTYTYTEALHGCTNTSSHVVLVNPFTAVGITLNGAASFCAGNSVTLNAGAYASYAWSNASTTSTISVNASGTYTVTATAANGCTGIDTQTITVYPLPVVSFTGLPANVCSDAGSIALTGNPVGGHFSGTGVTNNNFNPSSLSGNYTITYTYLDTTHSCSNSTSQVVHVNPIPTIAVTASGVTNFCIGNSVTLNAGAFTSYNWSTTATTSSITANTSGTYTVTVTAANGCTGTDAQVVNVYPLPVVSFSGLPASICSNAASVALTGNPLGGHYSGNGVTNTNFDPSSLSGNQTVTYTYTEVVHGCTNTTSQVVNVKPFTDVAISASGSTAFCAGGSVTLNAGVYATYNWNNAATTASITVNGAGTYSVTVAAANGCTGTDAQTITVYALPTVSFSGLPLTMCSNAGSITLTGNPVGGHFSGMGVTNNNFNPNGLNGTYVVTYTYTDTNHFCTNTSSHSVTVNPITPVVITTNGATSFCQGNNVTLNAGAYSSYTWNNLATTSTITVSTAGTYTVTATATNGCTGTDSQVITVYSLPVVTFSGLPANVCSTVGNITLTGAPAGGLFSGVGVTGNIFNPINNQSGNDTITYFYSDANGCLNSIYHVTNINIVNVVITPSGSTVFCQGGSVTLNAGVYSAYHWNTGATTASITVNTVGNNTYTITVTGAGGCTGIASQLVTVNPTPVVSISGLPISVCSNAGNITLTGTPVGGIFSGAGINGLVFNPANLNGVFNITYSYNDNVTGCYNSTTSTVTVSNVNPSMSSSGPLSFCANLSVNLTPGAYSTYSWSTGATTSSITVNTSGIYHVTVTGGSGCTGIATDTVTVYPLPTVDFTGLPASVCADAAPIALTGNPIGGSYSGTGMTGTHFNPNSLNGNYTVTYHYIESTHGCANTASHSITVNPFTTVVITPSGSTTFCQGGSVTLNTALYATYAWSNAASTNSITVNTSGTFTLTATSANGCSGVASVTVTVHPLPVVSFTGIGATTCSDAGNISLTGTPAGGNFNGPGLTGNIFNGSNLPTGTITITYSYTDLNGCANTSVQNVGVSNIDNTITTSGALNFCQGGSVTLSGAGSNTGFVWSNGATTQSTTVNTTGFYHVTVTGLYGCTSTNIDTVTVYPSPTINFTIAPSTICSDAAPITLSATPAGGTFSGTGVSNTSFNPHNLSGIQTITYNYLDTTHGCSNSATSTITVNVFPTLAITLSNGNNFCQGGSQTMTVAGSYASFIWSNGATTNSISANNTGNYTVTATAANGCTGTKSDSITVWPTPVVSFTGLPTTVVCNTWADFFLTPTPPGGNFFGPGINGADFNPYNLNTGTYSIVYYFTDAHGCVGYDTMTASINNCTGISELEMNNGMEIFPNPNNGDFTIHYNLTQPNATVNIHDFEGRIVATYEIKGTVGNQNINTQLSNGIYFWQIITTNGIAAKGKFSVEK